MKKLKELQGKLPDSTEADKLVIAQGLANKIHQINDIVGTLTEEEFGIMDEMIKSIDDELVVIENYQSMFNPVAAEHKADNRKQAIKRLTMLKEWKELMGLAWESSVKQVKAVRDMEKLSGILG